MTWIKTAFVSCLFSVSMLQILPFFVDNTVEEMIVLPPGLTIS